MRTALLTFALFGTVVAAADADTVAFLGPVGWSHTPPASSDATRTVDQWKLDGADTTVTFIKDSTNTYDGAMSAIRSNVATNHIKMLTDNDLPCRGATAHVVEFKFGPDGHQMIVNRIVIPDGSGVDTITYARDEDVPFDNDVKAAETTYCSAT